MKRLYILRHAKAGQTNKKIVDDHDRHLTDKGKEQCRRIADYFKESGAKIDHVLSSTSVRTTETIELSLKYSGISVSIEYISKLYLGDAGDILNEILTVENKHNNMVIVGHNPGLHQFALSLVKDGDIKIIRELSHNYPPGSITVIDFDITDWGALGWRTGHLVDFVITKS